MTQHLAKNLIHLGRFRLGLDAGPELPLDHRHRTLCIAALVVVSVELVSVEAVEVPHVCP